MASAKVGGNTHRSVGERALLRFALRAQLLDVSVEGLDYFFVPPSRRRDSIGVSCLELGRSALLSLYVSAPLPHLALVNLRCELCF